MTPLPSLRAPAPEKVRGSLRLATLPNALSVMRLLFLVPIVHLLRRPDPASDSWALLLLFVAGVSDLLDGFLARTRGEMSPSGKVVDPLADKVLIGGLIVYLAWARDFPVWLVALALARDLGLLLGAALFLRRDRVVFAADWTGKLTTFFFMSLIVAHVLQWRPWYGPLTAASAIALGLSYVSYGRRGLGFFRAKAESRA